MPGQIQIQCPATQEGPTGFAVVGVDLSPSGVLGSLTPHDPTLFDGGDRLIYHGGRKFIPPFEPAKKSP